MDESEIDIEPVGDGIAIHLPFRNLGGVRKAGWLFVGIGLFGTLFMLVWIGTPVAWGVDMIRQGGPPWFGMVFIAFGCLGLGGLFFALKMVALGIALLRNRTRCIVRVEDKRVVSKERFGWFSYNRKTDRDKVRQLYVIPLTSVSRSQNEVEPNAGSVNFINSIFGAGLESLHTITNSQRSGSLIAPGYPRTILDSVAAEMAKELNRNTSDSVLIDRSDGDDRVKVSHSITVQELSDEDIRNADFELPPDSELELIKEGESVVYRIPERSLWRGSGGLFGFSVLWNGFMLVFTIALLAGNANGDIGIMIIVASLFWVVGISMLVGSIYMARQSALVGVRDGLLFIERKTIFGTKWTEFTADQINAIEMGHANMEVNGVPVMNLQIQPHNDKPVSMFSHLDNAEIQWLAQQLRRSLDVESKHAPISVETFNFDQPIKPPAITDIKVQQEADRTIISVPPFDFAGMRPLQLVGLIFAVVPIPLIIVLTIFAGFEFFFIPFALIGTTIGSVIVGVHRMVTTRRFRIEATPLDLAVEVRGFWSDRDVKLAKPEIISVDVIDSDAKMNNQVLYCLRIKAKNGKGISMMTGRDQDQLIYVARLIHQRMNLTASPEESTSM